MHATLRKINEKIKTLVLQDKKKKSKFQWSFNKTGKTTLSQDKETKATEKATKDRKIKTYPKTLCRLADGS